MRVESLDDSVEMFTIAVTTTDGMNGSLKASWGTTALVADLMVH